LASKTPQREYGAMKGSTQKVVMQQQFEYAYLFGTVCPATGETEALITKVNREIMKHHLEQISAHIQSGRHGGGDNGRSRLAY
jgi:hypothetical protein